MIAVNVQQVKEHLAWRIKHDAVDSTTACAMMGIRKPSLIAMIQANKITGRMWDNRWWFPRKEVEKNIVQPGDVRCGRPRSGVQSAENPR